MLQPRDTERGCDGDICRIASGRHQNPADPRLMITRIERPPSASQVDFVPGAEVHLANYRHTNVAEISRRISCRYMHRAAKRDGQMLEVATNTLSLVVDVQRGFRRPGKVITECDVLVDPIADRLCSRPSRRSAAKQLPCQVRQPINLAIATGQQKLHMFL